LFSVFSFSSMSWAISSSPGCLVSVWRNFPLGFGPRLFGRTVGMTDYRISAIPLGGYVKMVGDEPDAELAPEMIPYSFTHKHVFKRIMIVAAGPFFNLLLAVIIYTGFFTFIGTEDIRPVVNHVVAGEPGGPGGPAARGRGCGRQRKRWPPGAISTG
jgi:membrane-associated protease RseP (regulator of RpoE activity)